MIMMVRMTFATLGYKVADGAIYGAVLSASHCMGATFSESGIEIAQNDWSSEFNEIAFETRDPTLFSGGDCPENSLCRYSDAAIAAINYNEVPIFPGIARPDNWGQWSSTLLYENDHHFTIIDEVLNILVGMDLDKVGRTTGWTRGPVQETCETVSHPDGGLLLCQYVVEAGADFGDSGSPVFQYISGDSVYGAGVLWGSTNPGAVGNEFVFSPLSGVRSDLGDFTIHDSDVSVDVSISGPSLVPENAECEWDAVVSYGHPPYSYEWRRDGVVVGTSSNYIGNSGVTDFRLEVRVTDDAQDSDTKAMEVEVVSDEESDACAF